MENVEKINKVSDLLERDGVIESISQEHKVDDKPYKLRKLSRKDISPMLKILKKIDLKKIKEILSRINISDLMKANEEKDEEIIQDEMKKINNSEEINTDFEKIGKELFFELLPVVLDSVDNCLPEVDQLLAGVTNLDVETIENFELDVYFSLIYDFVNKEEFMGFMKVASKFMKSEN